MTFVLFNNIIKLSRTLRQFTYNDINEQFFHQQLYYLLFNNNYYVEKDPNIFCAKTQKTFRPDLLVTYHKNRYPIELKCRKGISSGHIKQIKNYSNILQQHGLLINFNKHVNDIDYIVVPYSRVII